MNHVKISRKDAEKARHEIILQTAMEVFSRYGYYETKVDEIARKANVGKGTVYRHFENKQKLFLSVVEWGMESLEAKTRSATAGIIEARSHILTSLRAYFEFFEYHKDFYRVLINEMSTFQEQMEKRFLKKYFSHMDMLADIIGKGIKTGEFKNVDPHQCAVLFMGICNSLIFDWFYHGMKERLVNRVNIIEEIFFNGILQ